MEAAEKSDDGVKLCLDLSIGLSFETLFEFIIAVKGYKMWWFAALVHEVLETLISSLLEYHIVAESLFNKGINILFWLK